MPRIARVTWPGCPFHVTHRGNRGERVFLAERDHITYLTLLEDNARKAGLRIWAYALMPNHVHLLVVGLRADSMSRGIGNAHRKYSRVINQREGWTGHLWANRFYSTPLDEKHLWAAVRYIELNPVRAGIVRLAENYIWSSAPVHAENRSDALLDPRRPFPGAIQDWSAWLRSGTEDPKVNAIRENTSTGRPTGTASFVRELEKRLGRSFQRCSRGRKPASGKR